MMSSDMYPFFGFPFPMRGFHSEDKSMNVFDEVFMEMAKDPLIVERFKELAKAKLEELIPTAAEKMAQKTCDDLTEGYYNYRQGYREEVKKRLEAYFASPEGSAKMDQKIQQALEKSLDGSVISEAVRRYAQDEIGQIAQKAVSNALLSQKRKEERRSKKVAKK